MSKLAKKSFTFTGKKTRVWKLISIYFISSSVLKELSYCQNCFNDIIWEKVYFLMIDILPLRSIDILLRFRIQGVDPDIRSIDILLRIRIQGVDPDIRSIDILLRIRIQGVDD